jgi:RNA polymerase sigma factor (sigma-70 family)
LVDRHGVSAAYDADLELARQCAAGEETAWERFVLEYRPVLYRAADALDPTGGARDLADSLYADLYGIRNPSTALEAGEERKSLFRYFQGRSSLATWLRAVLAQRYVDRIRAQRRTVPLPDEERQAGHGPSGAGHDGPMGRTPDPDRARHVPLMQHALNRAIARLNAKDRLRLACYYAQSLTLAETGRLLREHEATVSRQLARTRRAIRESVERHLRDEAGLNDAQLAQCFRSASEDAGPIDLDRMLAAAARKETAPDRSI